MRFVRYGFFLLKKSSNPRPTPAGALPKRIPTRLGGEKALEWRCAYSASLSWNSRSGDAYRQSRAGHYRIRRMAYTFSRSARLVGDRHGHTTGAFHPHTSHHRHHARTFLFRLERASFLRNDVDRAGVRSRRIRPRTFGCTRTLHHLLVYQ